ncbi:stage V sporulation protein AC [Thermosyntropha lipolytica DSM 11003]|uniref:Stage V sporulation protein AC n=1 Tax=Thermosyntropha lipolytica DSM 11003 TaxID=1123382 RepID=A0A1M5M3J3_9FIRM|nr:stage V sporulation protein AC [Thermosyntropha lipolytica]SHG71786.1 stage V sporulation protein AC [Thermosyntropha lipolytica DSM 11003]
MEEQNLELKNIEQKEYDDLVNKVKPKPPVLKNCIWAFVVGGLICTLAQFIQNYFMGLGMSRQDAASYTSIIMIFLAALATGLGVYDELGKRAGAGSIVPITGFANAIVASAMEFKREGYIFGVGARIFSVAGPTLVFGFAVAFFIGLLKVFINS